MNKDNDILDKVGRRSGMTVPDGYFANFAKQMAGNLPEKEPTEDIALQRTMWQRIRPYIYMAAMFAGIWCMMKIFSDFSRTGSLSMENNQFIANALSSDNFYEDYYQPENYSEYELLEDMYDNGMEINDIFASK
ncbi:MAG: hypothetical protein IJY30_02130 [Muribaculaceae bacterium]|nr:hypothetical protein [Muribaculaceae bacterium]